MPGMAVSIESWVKDKIEDLRRSGTYESKAALKNQLISERPDKILEIRQAINKTKFTTLGPCAPENGQKKTKRAIKNGDSNIPEVRPHYSIPNIGQQSVLLAQQSTSTSEFGYSGLEELRNAVLCSSAIIQDAHKAVPQYALLGTRVCSPVDETDAGEDFRIFLNTNIPFSAFICGLQGSGKSHTVSCIIENCLIPSPILGLLQRPLSALAFHYAEHSSPSAFRPSELAYIANFAPEFSKEDRRPSVVVFVSPSSYPTLQIMYSRIPGVSVRPFKIQPHTLTIGTMLDLMAVNQDESPPLYISQVINVLRQMSSTGSGGFQYDDFRRRVQNLQFDAKQRAYLNQRLDLLESFLDLSGKAKKPQFAAGQLTVIDLSCPFMDENTACLLFRIGMAMFLESKDSPGKVIVVDEAHKFMRDTPAAKDLTEALLCVIREQRHYGARVIISTQEPTISPRLIDLCSLTIIHRFSSPNWFESLKRHIFVDTEDEVSATRSGGLFRRISSLRTGEALVFAPTAALRLNDSGKTGIARDIVKMAVRRRLTRDGGRSVVCV